MFSTAGCICAASLMAIHTASLYDAKFISLHSANVGVVGSVVGLCAASAVRNARHSTLLYSGEDVLMQYARAFVHSRDSKRAVLVAS